MWYRFPPVSYTHLGKEAMIPAVAEFVMQVDMDARTLTVELIPGFIDDEAVRTE